MAVYVNFFRGSSNGVIGEIGAVAARVAITTPNSTSRGVELGEMVIIHNADSGAVAVAWGTTPDADATTQTSATTAGYVVMPGLSSPPLRMAAGALINIKAL